jgi:Dolichyl-phosphate-mannose-protein mannosyltransferase
MADTGRIVYNGWATAMLGWQIYLGALFIKLFGFSFTAVRASALIVGMATAALLQRLFVRLGVNEWNSTLATLTLTVSPLFLPLTFSFMTDVPGLFAILVCLYGCIRAIQASSDRAAIQWLIFAAICNAVGGTARQIAWLGVLVIVPFTAWVIRRRRGALVVAAALWIVSALFIAGCMFWFKRQPYSVSEPLIVHFHFRSHNYQAILLFLLPILIAFVVHYPIKERWAQIQAGTVILAVAGLVGLSFAIVPTQSHSFLHFVLAPFSDGEVTTTGFEVNGFPGNQPAVLSMPIRVILTLLTYSAFFAFSLTAINASRLSRRPETETENPVSNQTILTILAPFTACYLVLLVTRAAVFERYFLPFLFLLLVFLLRFYQAKIAARLPVLTAVFVVIFAAYGVVTLHDVLAADRARLEAADTLRAAGVGRGEIRGGFEYDAWTQIELAGHLAPKKRWPSLPPCVSWWDSDTPAVHGRYQLAYSPWCFPESDFQPVGYNTWLPPHQRKIYILKRSE